MVEGADIRPRVGILPAEDRWITLTDGTRVYEGVEISYLLGQKLFDDGRFVPVLLDGPRTAEASRDSQIPVEWTRWQQSSEILQLPSKYQIRILPIVETLIFASGLQSNRVVFGFSPDHLNPFNEGRAGAFDNEFVASSEQLAKCERPDFFSGGFNPPGWGPFQSNFGSNIDEGAVIEAAGYGLGFKQKQFKIKSQIRFIIDDLKNETHREVVFITKGKGHDIFVTGSYQGYTLAFDIQTRKTLLQALKKLLPKVVDDLVKNELVPKKSTNVSETKLVNQDLNLENNDQQRLQEQAVAVADCFGNDDGDSMQQQMESYFAFYAVLRYFTVFDQPFHENAESLSPPNPKIPRVVLIDSGVDYNDAEIGSHVLRVGKAGVEGFDFISWDSRPSDDNGHGTAAAKYLVRQTKVPFELVIAKVIGSHGETHSSAIYDGFDYAIKNSADAIVVPWASAPGTLGAYVLGAERAAQVGIQVFAAPNTVTPQNNIYVPMQPSNSDFTALGLGLSQVRLDPVGVAVVDEFARRLNAKK